MLSARQLAIYEFIRQWQLERGYPPTSREICRGAGISSTSVVAYNLFRLREKGLVEYEAEGESRSVRIAGSVYVLPDRPASVLEALGTPTPTVGEPLGLEA